MSDNGKLRIRYKSLRKKISSFTPFARRRRHDRLVARLWVDRERSEREALGYIFLTRPLLAATVRMMLRVPDRERRHRRYAPISPLGLNYEGFYAEMPRPENISHFQSTTSGRPRLAGLQQLGIEPVAGYSLAINRIAQYGGGARNTSGLSQFIDALTTS